MAQIEKPILPLRLYRYRHLRDEKTISQEIDAIKHRYLWCSNFTNMNDPMEGFYKPSSLLERKSEFRRIVNQVLREKSNIGICCFSETKENELMWTHYASNYAGICIGYRAQFLAKGLPDDVHLVRWSYGDRPPLISSKEALEVHGASVKILSQKKFNWAYEREWRILGPLNKLNITRSRCITHLYVGSRIADDHKQRILDEFASSHIKIYHMSISDYMHSWKRLNPPPRRTRPLAKR